MEEGSGEKGK